MAQAKLAFVVQHRLAAATDVESLRLCLKNPQGAMLLDLCWVTPLPTQAHANLQRLAGIVKRSAATRRQRGHPAPLPDRALLFVHRPLQYSNVGQIAILLGIIQTVTDNKLVLDNKTRILRLNRHLAALRFIQ